MKWKIKSFTYPYTMHETETVMKDQSFPKYANLHIDGDFRLCITLDNGTTVPLTEPIKFRNRAWADESFRRLSLMRHVQTSLASALLICRKLLHAKRKKDALNAADEAMLTVAMDNLRNSRGNMSVSANGSGHAHGIAFIDAIDRTFKEAAEAAAATATTP